MQIAFTRRGARLRLRRVRLSVRPLPRRSMVVAGAVAVLFLSGCGAGGSAGSNKESAGSTKESAGTSNDQAAIGAAPAGGSGSRYSAPGAKSAPGGQAATPGAADLSAPGAPLSGVGPKLTKSASLDLQVKDVAAAAARVRGIAAGLQAQVLSEQIGRGGPGDPKPLQYGTEPAGGVGTLTLSVPADKLDTALDQLAKIEGTVLQRNTTSQDVTSQYVDTESRLKTMRASVERVRALMAQAKDLGQVVALESEMSRRQADLESLESQLAALKTSVERSTLAVSLSAPGNETATDNGFLAGLRSGWDAFTASAADLLRVIGAAMPFALFFGLLAAPAVVWWRRHRANQVPVVPATAAPAPAA